MQRAKPKRGIQTETERVACIINSQKRVEPLRSEVALSYEKSVEYCALCVCVNCKDKRLSQRFILSSLLPMTVDRRSYKAIAKTKNRN